MEFRGDGGAGRFVNEPQPKLSDSNTEGWNDDPFRAGGDKPHPERPWISVKSLNLGNKTGLVR
jgi:hypothetical protein